MQPLEKADDSIPRFVYECLQVIFHLSASSASPAIIYVAERNTLTALHLSIVTVLPRVSVIQPQFFAVVHFSELHPRPFLPRADGGGGECGIYMVTTT